MRALVLVLALSASPLQDQADEQYAYVAALAEKGLSDQVVREAQLFLREHAQHPKAELARYRLACALFELGREREAAPVLQELGGRAEFEFAAEVQFRLGQCLLSTGERAGAEAALRKVLAAGKAYLAPPALALLGQSELARKDHEHALAHFEELLARKDAGDYAADARCNRAWCLQRLGRTAAAAEAARAALAGAPPARKGELSFLLGECLLDAHDPRGALESYSAVRDGAFADAALRGSAFARAELGDHAGAAREFGLVLERFPQSELRTECALQQGIELLRAGDARAALRVLSGADLSADALALGWRARAEEATGDKLAALATVERALATRPDPESARRLALQRAELLAALGRGAEAQRIWVEVGDDRALLAAAVAALAEGRHDDAARLAGELLERFPQSALCADALLARAEGCFGAGRWKEAEAAFQAAARANGDAERARKARSRAAWCAYQASEFPRAAQAFDALAAASGDAPEIEEAAFMAARAREDAGDAGAVQAYERFRVRYPRSARGDEARLRAALLAPPGQRCRELEALAGRPAEGALGARARYERAWCRYEGKHYADCTRELEVVLADAAAGAPLQRAARELAAWSLVQAGELDLALRGWRELARAGLDEERCAPLLHALAGALLRAGREGDARAAVDDFAEAARTPRGRALASIERAGLLADAGKPDEAERELARARTQGAGGPALCEASFRLGEARFAQGADAQAIPLYDAAAEDASSPVADRALYKAGFARLRSNDAAGAERCFQRLVERHAQSELLHETLFLLGEAQFRQKRFDAAVASLERVRREAPRHALLPKVLFRLGLALGELQRWKESAEVLAALLRASPDFPNLAEAELGRGRALAESGDARNARVALERVLALDKGLLSAQAHLELGRLAYGAGDLDLALSEFLKVAVLYEGDEEVAEALVLAGRVLEEQKQPDKALAQYREVLQKHAKARYASEARQRVEALGSR